MFGRLAFLGLTLALAGCDQIGFGRRDSRPVDDFAARGERAFNRITGREDPYAEDAGYDDRYGDGSYERGVRDGLRGTRFDREDGSQAYARGYEAGRRERDRYGGDERSSWDRTSDRERTAQRAPVRGRASGAREAPRRGLRACIDEVERMWDLDQGAASAVSARMREDGDYVVAVSAGRRRADCVLSPNGEIQDIQDRRSTRMSGVSPDTRDLR